MLAFFATPPGEPVLLTHRPQLASWNAAGHPDQVTLGEYLDATEQQISPQLDATPGPVAIRLDVGLAADQALLVGRDVDNYLHPLIARLTPSTEA
jgi:hypothetical protein